MSEVDALTGLGRYPVFWDRFSELISRSQDSDSPLSLSIIDLDHFGRLNARVGTESADQILKKTADFLVGMLAGFAEVFRYGGDAFSLIMPSTEKEQTFFRVEQVRAAFEQHMKTTFEELDVVPVTFSAGIATFPDDGTSAHDVVRKASEAMYRAKNAGRNRVCLAREERMVTKTSHYTQGQLQGLSRLAKRMNVGEAVLLREALDDLLRKYNA